MEEEVNVKQTEISKVEDNITAQNEHGDHLIKRLVTVLNRTRASDAKPENQAGDRVESSESMPRILDKQNTHRMQLEALNDLITDLEGIL